MNTNKTLAQHFAYYTECQLATLRAYERRKSTPQCELNRQRDIANGMVAVAGQFLESDDLRNCPRLMEALPNLMEALPNL